MKRSGFLRATPSPSLTVKLKPIRCKAPGCINTFERRSMTHRACSPECSLVLVAIKAEKDARQAAKVDRAETKQRREKLKTRSDWIKEAQVAFNKFIRNRDAGKPCICCGKHGEVSNTVGGGAYDAGHYRSIGSAPHLRFDETNCHAQLKQCNRYGSGRAVDYRIGLIARIGRGAVEALECDQTQLKLGIDELRSLRDEYRAKARALENA